MAHPAFKDISGQRFGRWLVIEKSGNAKGGGALWRCQCDCGTISIVAGGTLRTGATNGCNACAPRVGKHGDTGKRLYKIWTNMKSRCLNEKNPRFPDYGGRGIKVCEDWLEYPNFKRWALSYGYADDLSLEREDVNAGYSAENCTWIPIGKQRANRRDSLLSPDGRLLLEVAKENGITRDAFYTRIKRGVDPMTAAQTPMRKR